MAWLLWLDKWELAGEDYIAEAELCYDTKENAIAAARACLDGLRPGEGAHVQVVELWNEDNCALDEQKEVA